MSDVNATVVAKTETDLRRREGRSYLGSLVEELGADEEEVAFFTEYSLSPFGATMVLHNPYGRAMVQGTVRRGEPKVGRNDRCPCGSGKKYKKCCGR